MSNGLSEFLDWWRRKCGRNWAVLTSIVAGIIAFITLYNMLGPVWADMRPWATPHHVTLIAERTYPRALADQQQKTISLEARLKWLQDKRALGELEPPQHAEIPVMQQLIRESKEEEAQIIRERTFFRQLEHAR